MARKLSLKDAVHLAVSKRAFSACASGHQVLGRCHIKGEIRLGAERNRLRAS